jgi:NADH dehydrogenase/NADH:ubiquinone oxidoreductase subunit G
MYINGTIVSFDADVSILYNVMQHCDSLGIEIPRFCYHDHLSIAGNCRMCLVESSSAAKPVLACSTEVAPELEIYTNSILVKQAREQMLEFLLINHPLDCPICDQGGECDLQDLTYVYGSDSSRYAYEKRGVSPFYFGPLIKVIMTRCIQCTRCIRFLDELLGITLLGSAGRGTSNTITTYLPAQYMLSTYNTDRREVFDYSPTILGNIADICPVGALTIKPSAYTLRAWEMIVTETIDPLDSLCSNIRIDTNGVSIVRVLPRLNATINHEWITDKIRFVGIGLSQSRLFVPLIYGADTNRRTINQVVNGANNAVTVSWDSAYNEIARSLAQHIICSSDSYMQSVNAYSGGLIDMFSMFQLKWLCAYIGMSSINSHISLETDIRTTYLFTDTLACALNSCSILFVLASNIRKESPVLNIRVSNNMANRQNTVSIVYIGSHSFTKYSAYHLGNSYISINKLCSGKVASSILNSSSNSTWSCIIGNTAQRHVLQHSMLRALMFSVNYLSTNVGSLHVLDLDALPRYNIRSLFC